MKAVQGLPLGKEHMHARSLSEPSEASLEVWQCSEAMGIGLVQAKSYGQPMLETAEQCCVETEKQCA